LIPFSRRSTANSKKDLFPGKCVVPSWLPFPGYGHGHGSESTNPLLPEGYLDVMKLLARIPDRGGGIAHCTWK
jgi:hypothetical protein